MQKEDQGTGARLKNCAMLQPPATTEVAGDDSEAPRHEQNGRLKPSGDSVEFPEQSQPSSSGLQARALSEFVIR